MATPFQALVDEIRGLPGGARVSYPENNAAYPLVERVLRIKRGQHLPTFLEPDPDSGRFPGNKLTEQVEVKSDAQWVEVYRKYEILPGPASTTVELDVDGAPMTVSRRKRVRADIQTDITAGAENIADDGTWTRMELESINGSTLLATEVIKSRALPGFTIYDVPTFDPLDKAPVYINRTLKRKTPVVEKEGDVPSNSGTAINVSTIGTGATCTVTLASNHGRSVGDWVHFVDTNSTPPLGASLQIVGVPAADQITVAGNVTMAGTAAGTMQPLWPSHINSERFPNSSKVVWEVVKTRLLPGPTIPETPTLDDADAAPLFHNKTLKARTDILEGEGDVPPNNSTAFTISAIAIGTLTSVVTFTTNHGLSAGMWMQFLDTNSTPPLPRCRQIVSVPGSTQVKVGLLKPVTIAGTSGTMQPLWPRTTMPAFEGSPQVAIELVKARIIPGPTRPSKPRIDSDKGVWSVNKTLVKIGTVTVDEVYDSNTKILTVTKEDEFENSVKVSWKQDESRILPGLVITESDDNESTGIPILTAKQKVSDTALFTEGEFQPAPLTVNSITAGSSPTVTLATAHDLPIGAYVTFGSTTATPSLNGTPLRIVATPSTTSVQVTPASAITGAQSSPAGTMVATNRIVRKIKATEVASIKLKIDEMVAVPNVSVHNEDVECQVEHAYPFPDFLKQIPFYTEAASSHMGGLANSTSTSWGGAVGLPIQAGYRGPSEVLRKRFFFVGPPPDSFGQTYPPTIIIPSSGTFVIAGGASSSQTTTSGTGYSRSNNWRTGVIPEVLTGESPAVTNVLPNSTPDVYNIASVGAASGFSLPQVTPQITLTAAHNLAELYWVKIAGSTSTPSVDGTWVMISIPGTTSFQIQTPRPITNAGGAAGTVTLLGTSTGGAGYASCYLDLPQSFPPKLVASLTVAAVGTGATPTVTLSDKHYLQVGQFVKFTNTTSTPSIDGFQQVSSIPGPTQITISPASAVTMAQSTTAGTMQTYLTKMDLPRKLGQGGMWEVYVHLVKIRFTSGDNPS